MRILIYTILMALIIVAVPPAFGADNPREVKLEKYPGLQQIIEKSEFKDAVIEALKDAGSNWENLAKAIVAVSGPRQADLLWQITVMPHLDRLEATPENLLEHLEYAYKAKETFKYKIPDNMFREYILVYRIGSEPLYPWRKMLFDRFKDMAGDTPSDTAKNVNKWIAENVKKQERGFFGPQMSPDQVIKNGIGTENDVATLTTAILKTLGVPSRSARCTVFGQQKGGATWVEIFDGTNWVPLYPDDPASFGDFKKFEKTNPQNITVVATTSAFDALQVTPNYTDTGKIEMTFLRHGILQTDFQHYAVAVYNDGGWLPLDDLGFDLEEARMSEQIKDGVFKAVLGDGTYLVEAGVRVKDGSVYMFTKQVEVKAGDIIPMEIKLDPPIQDLARTDLVVRELPKPPQWELPIFESDGRLYSSMANDAKFGVIAIFDINGEPSRRMIPALLELKKYEKSRISVVAIHAGPVDKQKLHDFLAEYKIDFPVAIDESGKVAEAYGLQRNKEDDKHFGGLPSILLMYKGDLLLWEEGFDPGIASFIIDAVDYQESLPWMKSK